MSGNYGKQLTEPLKIARVLCIFFVIYAHVGTPTAPVANNEIAWLLHHLMRALHEGLSKISVPLLGVISGFLAYGSINKTSHLSLVKRKFSNLIVPMVAWSVVMMSIHLAYGIATWDIEFIKNHLPNTPLGWANAFLAITDWPTNTPLYFLRDIFLCYVLLPVFLILLRINIYFCFAFASALFLSQGTFWIVNENIFHPLIRPGTSSFFILGLAVGHLQSRAKLTFINQQLYRLIIPLTIITIAAISLKAFGLANFSGLLESIRYASVRVVGLLFFWTLAIYFSRHTTTAKLSNYERYAYLVFCMHYPLTYVISQALGTISHWKQPWYVNNILFIIAPFICFAVANPLFERLRRHEYGRLFIGLPRSIEAKKAPPQQVVAAK